MFLFPFCHEACASGLRPIKRGDCLSHAKRGASFGASGHGLDAQAHPTGLVAGRLLLVPFSSTWKKMNK